MEQQCENCRFWERYEDGDIEGECHRYPPRFACSEAQQKEANSVPVCLWHGWFPETKEDDWCGEWREIVDSDREAILNTSICSLGMSVRARNCLANDEIFTLRQLCNRTERDLLDIRSFGETTLIEIKEMLRVRGLALRSDAIPPKAKDGHDLKYENSSNGAKR